MTSQNVPGTLSSPNQTGEGMPSPVYSPLSVAWRAADTHRVDWRRVSRIAITLSTVFSACAIPLAGHWIAQAVSKRELSLRYVTLAVDILREKPSKENQNIRRWATDIINHYSDVKLPAETITDLIERSPLPFLESTSNPLAGPDLGASVLPYRYAKAMLNKLGYYEGPVDDIPDAAFR